VGSSATLETVASAIGDPVRARILDLLAQGRHEPCCSPTNPSVPRAVCACDIRDALGGMAASRLAYHLRVLRQAGLVREARRGKWVYYTLDSLAFDAFSRAVGARWAATASRPPARTRRRGPSR
jgi:DNA-binding transcriptional ArsR family regulator